MKRNSCKLEAFLKVMASAGRTWNATCAFKNSTVENLSSPDAAILIFTAIGMKCKTGTKAQGIESSDLTARMSSLLSHEDSYWEPAAFRIVEYLNEVWEE